MRFDLGGSLFSPARLDWRLATTLRAKRQPMSTPPILLHMCICYLCHTDKALPIAPSQIKSIAGTTILFRLCHLDRFFGIVLLRKVTVLVSAKLFCGSVAAHQSCENEIKTKTEGRPPRMSTFTRH